MAEDDIIYAKSAITGRMVAAVDENSWMQQEQMKMENKLVIPNDGGTNERMMKWLAYEHLPRELQDTVSEYRRLGHIICTTIPPGPERTVALRKLVESKDCAVRAVIEGMSPGQAAKSGE